MTAKLLCSWTGNFTFHRICWHVKSYCLEENIISSIYVFPGEIIQLCQVLLQDTSKEMSGPLWLKNWGNSSLSDSSSLHSKVIFRIIMLLGYFPDRHFGNKLFPATVCGRWHQFIGCRELAKSLCIKIGKKKRCSLTALLLCQRI